MFRNPLVSPRATTAAGHTRKREDRVIIILLALGEPPFSLARALTTYGLVTFFFLALLFVPLLRCVFNMLPYAWRRPFIIKTHTQRDTDRRLRGTGVLGRGNERRANQIESSWNRARTPLPAGRSFLPSLLVGYSV